MLTCFVQLLDRHRHTPVITALSAGGQSGLLATLMRGTIAGLTDPTHDPQLSVTPSFADALFSLIGALVASSTGCTALASAGLIPAFLPMLGDTNPDHINLVSGSAMRVPFARHWVRQCTCILSHFCQAAA